MASTWLHMDSANIFVGDDDPSNALFNIIKNVKLPALEEITKEHLGGGSIGKAEVGMGAMEALSLTFQLEGFNPDQLSRFMPGAPGRIKYTVRGNVRDVREHTDLEVKAVVEGRMTKVEKSEFEREQGITTDYEIKEVLFYQLHYAGQEKFYYDYFAGPIGVRVDGTPRFAARARNLGLA